MRKRSAEGLGPKPREGFGKAVREDDDVEGHGMQKRSAEGLGPKPREGFGKAVREDDDVEGHGMQKRSAEGLGPKAREGFGKAVREDETTSRATAVSAPRASEPVRAASMTGAATTLHTIRQPA